MLRCCGCKHISFSHFFNYFTLLFFLFRLWPPGDVWDSCSLVIAFHFFFFLKKYWIFFFSQVHFLDSCPLSLPPLLPPCPVVSLCSFQPLSLQASLLMDWRDSLFPAACCFRCFILVLLSCWERGAEQLIRGWRRGSCWMQLSSVKAALLGVGCELGFVGDSLEFVG